MIKIPVEKYYKKYGKEYEIELRHKINLWCRYKIDYKIDNTKYGLKSYKDKFA